MFEIVARELRAKLLGRQRGLADTTQQHSATGVEGAGGTGGHGCGGRGRWRGQGGLRDDALSHTQQHSTAGVEGTGGTGEHKRAWPRCRWAAAGPGRDHTVPEAPPMWRAPEGPEGTGGLRDRPLRAAGSRVAISRAAGPDGAQNTSGPASTSGARAKRPYSPPPGSGRPV